MRAFLGAISFNISHSERRCTVKSLGLVKEREKEEEAAISSCIA